MNVPKLRFSEFEGEWEEVEFGEIVGFRSGGTPSKSVDSYWDGDIPWISAASMHHDRITTSERSVTELGAENGTRKAEKNTVLLLVRGSMLYNRIPAGICDRLVTFNQDVKALAPMGDEAPAYILAFIRAKEDKLLSMVTGTGIGAGKLDTDELKALRFDRPSLPEQKKIAAFLGVVDAKIAALRARRDGLERYKRGLMQALFSQTLRFTKPDGTAFPDWEEKRLGDVATIKAGDFVKASEIFDSSEGGRYDCYGGNGLRGYVAKYNRDGRLSLIGRQGALCGNVHFVTGKFYATEHALVAECAADVSPEWLYFLLGFMDLNQYATGQAQPGISAETVKKLAVSCPSLPEQQKIADALSTMDGKIASVTGHMAQMEAFKKGLLQQMFV